MRAFDRDLIRGGHYGQRSCDPRKTGRTHGCSDQCCKVKILLANPEPSTHGPSRHFAVSHKSGRFSNRPFEVKHYQTIRHCNVDVAHGLALLFGIGTRALPSWDPRTRWNNLSGGLALPLAGPSDLADSPHPSSREGHHSTVAWSSSFLLLGLICHGFHAAGT